MIGRVAMDATQSLAVFAIVVVVAVVVGDGMRTKYTDGSRLIAFIRPRLSTPIAIQIFGWGENEWGPRDKRAPSGVIALYINPSYLSCRAECRERG